MKRPVAENWNGQQLVRKTQHRGNHPTSLVWVLRCRYSRAHYGANGFDFHLRPGLPIPA
jgi:hypothetical protein